MEKTITGLTVFAVCYGILYLLTPIWRRGWLPAWTRIPRGIVAWALVLSLIGPGWGMGEVLVELFTAPSAGTGYAFGFYALLMLFAAWIYSNHEAINYAQVRPFIDASLRFARERWNRDDVFAGAEQKKIEAIYEDQTGRRLKFDPLRGARQHQTTASAQQELEAVRRDRQAQAGAEDLAMLRSGQSADITDVLRLFTMHRPPHPRIEHTFRVVIDPVARVCRLDTVFPGLRRSALANPDARFRFQQEIVDLFQVFTSQPWLERFRPHFETMMLAGHVDVRNSFDLPERQEFLRVTIDLKHLDAQKGTIFIATELGRLGTMEWLEGDDA